MRKTYRAPNLRKPIKTEVSCYMQEFSWKNKRIDHDQRISCSRKIPVYDNDVSENGTENSHDNFLFRTLGNVDSESVPLRILMSRMQEKEIT